MVEHVFALPEMEAEWNAWYAGNVRVLIRVPGFKTAQRFKAEGTSPPRYMAMYTVDSAGVFESADYRNAGGGGSASLRFRPAYHEWVRNLFASDARAPVVEMNERLWVVDAADEREFAPLSPAPLRLRVAGLHRTTPFRALAVVSEAAARGEPYSRLGVLYRPLTAQLAP